MVKVIEPSDKIDMKTLTAVRVLTANLTRSISLMLRTFQGGAGLKHGDFYRLPKRLF